MTFKILFIAVYNSNNIVENIGISSVAAFMRKNGIAVKIITTTNDQINKEIIVQLQPNLIGISIFQSTEEIVINICKDIKSKFQHIPICTGGIYPSYNYHKILNNGYNIDFVVIGEGELTLLELVYNLSQNKDVDNIKGLAYIKNNNVVVNDRREYIKDLSILPPLARDILIDNNLCIPNILSSRSCTCNCSFCSIRSFWGKYREMPINHLIQEIKDLFEKGYKYFYIQDTALDNSNTGQRLKEILKEIYNLKIDIIFIASFCADFYKKIDDETLFYLKNSGLLALGFGIESNNMFDNKLYGKRAIVEDNTKVLEFCNENNLSYMISFMFFNPYSSKDTLIENIDFLDKFHQAYNFSLLFSKYTPFNGTRLHEKVKKDNLLIEKEIGEPAFIFRNKDIELIYNLLISKIFPYYEGKNVGFFSSNKIKLVFKDFYLRFPGKEHEKINHIAHEFENKIEEIYKELSKLNVLWYKELLSIKDESETPVIENKIKQILSKEQLVDFKRRVEKLYLIFYYKLCHENEKYKQWYLNNPFMKI